LTDPALTAESIPLADLTPHPRNYRRHPPDQLAHLAESLRTHGFYRPIVVASDLTILAGHGIALAAVEAGYVDAPVIRLPIAPDSPSALKLVAGDNEAGRLAEVDDRALADLLKDVMDAESLLGTGYDDAMLANLVYITRDASEIRDMDAAAQWVGMPEFDAPRSPRLIVSFDNEDDRSKFVAKHKLTVTKALVSTPVWQAWWPTRDRDDVSSVKFTDE
jgi:hypothetical protein